LDVCQLFEKGEFRVDETFPERADLLSSIFKSLVIEKFSGRMGNMVVDADFSKLSTI
jgi:hypothetical protein